MRALCLAIALVPLCTVFGGAAPVPERPIVLVWSPAGAAPDLDNGVRMGAAEAQQTATLLGRTVRLEPHASGAFVSILPDANGLSLKAAGCTFHLAPSAEMKAAILARWKKQDARDGDYRIAVWHASLKQFGGSDLNERFVRRFHQPMSEGAWLGWVAVKAAVEAALRGNGPACSAIASLQFDGHKGAALSFNDGVLQQPLYVIAGDKVVAEVNR